MSDYDNTNKGVLFKNDKKETDKHPDYNGSINVNGVEHFLSAWVNTSKAGNKYMSVSIGKVKEVQNDPTEHASGNRNQPNPTYDNTAPPQSSGSDFDDDLPF